MRALTKSKLTANFLITLLLVGLFIAAIIGIASVSQQASAQPPYPVPNVTVSALGNSLSGGEGHAVTNSQGQYSITSYLGTDNYTLTTSGTGYVNTEVDNVPVTAGETTSGITITVAVSGIITGK